ncbi:DALR anticodon-binding domain-containing protein [Streptomyces sp. XM4193]|uniref:DALR anticodon-binding domain-containing protein n=1 Tax=Streptomyces sp. XM4193 TaxID=2929782 RepID=UPI001FFBF85A|nr:DALR anticodon-binding domain-containing protein [Streptomyces sp. XM4193]MCK1797480.1 DALR anticodon-binding domain-containing protein [Streptomyces sp. XM4193]
MTPNQLQCVLLQTLRHAIASGELPPSATAEPERVTLRKPPHGDADFASPLALRLAPVTGHPAREIAEILRNRLAQEQGIDSVEVAGPGFLNITLRRSAHTELVRALLARDADRAPDTRTAHGTSPPDPAAPGSAAPELPEDPRADATRWAALTGRPISYERRDSQPLFRIQYARSRSRSLAEGARALGFDAEPGDYRRRSELTLLTLLADTAQLTDRARADTRPGPGPETRAASETRADTRAETGAESRAETRVAAPAAARPVGGSALALAHHLTAVADAFLAFTSAPDALPVLPRGDEKPEAAHRSRLALAEATGTVLAGGLTQLGISAPHHL